jgi:hypothetical protein
MKARRVGEGFPRRWTPHRLGAHCSATPTTSRPTSTGPSTPPRPTTCSTAQGVPISRRMHREPRHLCADRGQTRTATGPKQPTIPPRKAPCRTADHQRAAARRMIRCTSAVLSVRCPISSQFGANSLVTMLRAGTGTRTPGLLITSNPRLSAVLLTLWLAAGRGLLSESDRVISCGEGADPPRCAPIGGAPLVGWWGG